MYVVSLSPDSNGVYGVRYGHVFFAGACVAAAAASAFRFPSPVETFLGIQKKAHLSFFPPSRYIGDNQYIGVFSPYWLSPITSFHHIGDNRYYRDILESISNLTTVFVGSDDKKVYALNTMKGTQRWTLGFSLALTCAHAFRGATQT